MVGMTLPAPTGGWNAVSALSSMPPTDAIRLDNLIPSANDVRSRSGYTAHTSAALSSAQSLISYEGSTPKMLLGANADIYDITTAGTETRIGGPGGSLRFNAAGSGAVDFGNVLDQTTGDFSIEFKILVNAAIDDYPQILSKKTTLSSAAHAGYAVFLNTSAQTVKFVVSDGTNQVACETTTALVAGTRKRVSVTFEYGVYARIYFDGVEDASSPFDVSSVVGSLTTTRALKMIYGGTTADYTVDDVRFWSDVRTPAEISANMDVTVSPSAAGLAGYWKMDDGTGSTASDSHASANDGTITGTTTWANSLLSGIYTSNKWYDSAFKDKVILCNSADTPVVYDGATGVVSDVAVTGPTATDLAGSVTFKGRAIYWEKSTGANPQSFWYAAAGSYQGALTEYELTQLTTGGYVVECLNWTHDGGQGLDDHFVVLMSTGQVLVYSGSDPGSASDWFLIGIYQIGRPVGSKPSIGLGGDAVVITTEGYLILSAAIQDARTSEKSEFSFKISNAAREAAQAYGDQFGWEACLHSNASLLVFNVPISATESVQHVRNTTTGGWCRFTGINAVAWCANGGQLYFVATDGYVYRYGGFSDSGAFIPLRSTGAYNYFGDPGRKKQVTAIQIMSNYAYPKYLFSTFWADYNEKSLPAITDPPEPTVSEWDVGAWDSAQWDVTTLGTNVARKNAHGYGYCLAHTLRLKTRSQQFIWYASHLYMKAGGMV